MQDHAPYAHAFIELANLTILELMEDVYDYNDALRRSARYHVADEALGDDEAEEDEGDEAEEMPGLKADAELSESERLDLLIWAGLWDLAQAHGFVPRTKANRWKLFCERLNVPPFLMWEVLPCFDHLQCALAGAEKMAFAPEGYLRWLNRIRPAGEPELATVPYTVEGMADATERLFRPQVEWWGG